MTIESAIPEHLRTERRHPAGRPDDYVPVVPAIAAQFSPQIVRVVMAYFGVQYRGDRMPAAAAAALTGLGDCTGGQLPPTHGIDAEYIDEAGFTNRLAIRYWPDVASYDAWRTGRTAWTDPARRSDEVGFFSEVLTPTVERFETVFSEGEQLEGVAVGVATPSGPIREHSYWGSARDRLPVSQIDRLEPSGDFRLVEDGPVQVVEGTTNLALIQSGQDWSGMLEETKRRYVEDVEPLLREAMDDLVDSGDELGCISNRYLRVLGADGRPRERTFGLSWWRDFAQLEQWAAGHPKHRAVFKAGMSVMLDPDPARRVWLYHEVCVSTPDQQDFRYLGCHDHTGLLRAVR